MSRGAPAVPPSAGARTDPVPEARQGRRLVSGQIWRAQASLCFAPGTRRIGAGPLDDGVCGADDAWREISDGLVMGGVGA